MATHLINKKNHVLLQLDLPKSSWRKVWALNPTPVGYKCLDIEVFKFAGGDFSHIFLRSQQGDNGGAHDEDPLGSIKVYGDRVEEDDIRVQSRVFDGIDKLDEIMDTTGPDLFVTDNGMVVSPLTQITEDMIA